MAEIASEYKIDICAFSDSHGHLPVVPPFDLLLVGGDICPPHNHYFSYQIGWFQKDFARWVKCLPYKDSESRVVLIGGNHDYVLQDIEQEHIDCFNITCGGRLVYLKSSSYEYHHEGIKKPIKIFGSPWCSIFYDWAFMINDSALTNEYDKIPEDCDIFISHDSPTLGGLGWITEGRYVNYTTGNRILSDYIEKKKPKIFLSGHFHSGIRRWQNINGTIMKNISYVDEQYKPRLDGLTTFQWPFNQENVESSNM